MALPAAQAFVTSPRRCGLFTSILNASNNEVFYPLKYNSDNK